MEDLIKNTEFICLALTAIVIITGIGICIIIAHLKEIIEKLKLLDKDNEYIINCLNNRNEELLMIKYHLNSVINDKNDK